MTDAAEDLQALPGPRLTLVERYSGGEGRTLRVRCRERGDLVLKILPPGVEPAEASLLLALRHAAIPAVREVGRLPDGRAFVLRDHVDGQALRRLPREPAELLDVLQQLLEVLAFVHLRAVLHLDLKPANLLRDAAGRVHLLDFGLGARRGAHGSGGTPFFIAPELLLGSVPDARADLFSVGAMVAQALWPGSGPPLGRFVSMFPRVDFFAAGDLAAHALPAPFDRFVARCVARRPSERFPDAQAALEFVCGRSGRPSPELLAPDPALLFAHELTLAAAGDHDLVLAGADADDRRALALHLAATGAGVRTIVERDDSVRLQRGGGDVVQIDLPALDAARLHPHVEAALGLEGAAARAAAAWLAQHAGQSAATVHRHLLALAQHGELLPSGSRWTWPAARSGRLGRAAPPTTAPGAATPDDVRTAACAGRREPALALYRQAAATDPDHEPTFRRALAEGLLDGGEPAAALPFCSDLPVLRAQALLETGQVAAAARELPPTADAAGEARHRRVAGQLLIAAGRLDAARALLQHDVATPLERLTLAAALEQAGELDASERLLETVGAELDGQPFARASAHTVLGHVRRRRGDLAGALASFEAARELLFQFGHVRHAATAQLNLGVIHKDLGDHAAAIRHLREARTMFEHAGDTASAARATASLGIAALARGDAAAAVPWLRDGAAALRQLGDVAAGQVALAMLARAHAELGAADAAEELLRQLGDDAPERVQREIERTRTLLAAPPRPATAPTQTRETTMPKPRADDGRTLFRTFLAVNRQLAQATDLDQAMRHLLDAAVTLSGGRLGYLLIAHQDGMRREIQSGDPGQQALAFSRSLAHRAMDLQRTLTGADGLADRDLQDMPSIRNLEVRSAICSPFRSAGGVTGALYVEHPGRADVFDDADKEALEVLADQAAIAVDRMCREEALAKELSASKRELALVHRTARREATRLLGDSAPMRDLRAQIARLAPLDLPVLILGETGSGKELVARALHEQSPRHRGPFVAENCSALPPELMDRELFGHVQGAFTGADRDRPGLLELASGGTLLLDEVGDMPPELQAKLLRALQEQSIRRVGGSETVQLDLRLVAATHKDLRAMVAAGTFREDLFYRLAAVELPVPPLRDRGGDAVLLAEHFLQRHAQTRGRTLRLSPVVKAALADYRWPGNVRELDHLIARAALLCERDEIVDLQLPRPAAAAADAAPPSPADVVTLKEAERRAMIAALQACGGDKAKTARALGISRTALYDKIKRHGIDG